MKFYHMIGWLSTTSTHGHCYCPALSYSRKRPSMLFVWRESLSSVLRTPEAKVRASCNEQKKRAGVSANMRFFLCAGDNYIQFTVDMRLSGMVLEKIAAGKESYWLR